MAPIDDRILDRIRKVKNLADNAGTEGEAHAAICALQNLLAKYNVDLGEIMAEDNTDPEQTVDRMVVDECGQRVMWRGWLGMVIASNFRCEVWWSGWRRHEKLMFMGLTNDVTCAKAAYQSAALTMERLKEDYINQRRTPGIGLGTWAHADRTSEGLTAAKAFRAGFITGLQKALRENSEKMALVLLKDARVTEAKEKLNLSPGRASYANMDGDWSAREAGFKAGATYARSSRANKLRPGSAGSLRS